MIVLRAESYRLRCRNMIMGKQRKPARVYEAVGRLMAGDIHWYSFDVNSNLWENEYFLRYFKISAH